MAMDVRENGMTFHREQVACMRYGFVLLCAVVCMLGASCGRDDAREVMYVFGTPHDLRCEWWVNGEPVAVTRSAMLMHQDGFLQNGSNTITVVATELSGEKAYLAVDVRRVTDFFEKGGVVASLGQFVPAGHTVTATMTFVAAQQKTLPLKFYDDVTMLSDRDTNILTMAVEQMVQAFANTNVATCGGLRVARLATGNGFYDRIIIAEANYGMEEVQKYLDRAKEYSFARLPLNKVGFLKGGKLVCAHADGYYLWEGVVKTKHGKEVACAPTWLHFLRYTGEWLRVAD